MRKSLIHRNLKNQLLNGKSSSLKFKKVDSLTSEKYVDARKNSMKKLQQDIKKSQIEPQNIIVLH